eukprot:Hpha_TRINITY_DN5820_c0_g1::TRINITY_DN5820_c0_g1_i1::g.45581::m.45581
MHTFPISAKSNYEWTEYFKGFHADVSKVHSQNYSDAVKEVGDWMASDAGVPQSTFAEIDAFLANVSTMAPKPENILFEGLPWGGLREVLTGQPLVPGDSSVPFSKPAYTPQTRQWLDLARNGTFSNETLRLMPINFEVDEKWLALLHQSVERNGETWLHHLFIGTYQLEVGDADAARKSFNASLKLKPSPHAFRNLALFAATEDEAAALYASAWSELKKVPSTDPSAGDLAKDLSGEIATWLLLNERWGEVRSFLNNEVPREYASKDRILHARAGLAVHDGDWKTAVDILTSHCFPTFGSERSRLINLWFQAKLLEAKEANGGKDLTKRQVIKLRKTLGCDGDVTSSAWNDKCSRGPPNLGIAYGGF